MQLRLPTLPLAGTLLAGLVLAAGAAPAQPLAWDQQQVTKTVVDTDHAIDALLADPELNSQQATAMQQREHIAAVASARQLLACIETLRSKVAAGYDRDESWPFWEQCEELRGDIRAYARHSWLPEATSKRADAAQQLLDKLDRYYQNAR